VSRNRIKPNIAGEMCDFVKKDVFEIVPVDESRCVFIVGLKLELKITDNRFVIPLSAEWTVNDNSCPFVDGVIGLIV
jgi:hypothetical protein